MSQFTTCAFNTVGRWRELGEVENECTLRICILFVIFVHCTRNYQSWWKFDEVLTKTTLHIFDTLCCLDLTDAEWSVCGLICMRRRCGVTAVCTAPSILSHRLTASMLPVAQVIMKIIIPIYTRDDREWLFTFPLPPISVQWIPIPSHSHSQFCNQFPFPWDSHQAFPIPSHSHSRTLHRWT